MVVGAMEDFGGCWKRRRRRRSRENINNKGEDKCLKIYSEYGEEAHADEEATEKVRRKKQVKFVHEREDEKA